MAPPEQTIELGSFDLPEPALEQAAPEQPAPVVAAPVMPAVPAVQETADAEVEAELLEIFIMEAEEVLTNVDSRLPTARAQKAAALGPANSMPANAA